MRIIQLYKLLKSMHSTVIFLEINEGYSLQNNRQFLFVLLVLAMLEPIISEIPIAIPISDNLAIAIASYHIISYL